MKNIRINIFYFVILVLTLVYPMRVLGNTKNSDNKETKEKIITDKQVKEKIHKIISNNPTYLETPKGVLSPSSDMLIIPHKIDKEETTKEDPPEDKKTYNNEEILGNKNHNFPERNILEEEMLNKPQNAVDKTLPVYDEGRVKINITPGLTKIPDKTDKLDELKDNLAIEGGIQINF